MSQATHASEWLSTLHGSVSDAVQRFLAEMNRHANSLQCHSERDPEQSQCGG